MSTYDYSGHRSHLDGIRASVPSVQGEHPRQLDHLHRPQDDRVHVPDRVVHLLLPRRRDGADHPRRAVRAGPADRADQGAVQPAVHHARHDHAADVRDAAVRRLRERDHAAADRRARRRVPAAERAGLLVLPRSAASSPSPASSPRRAPLRSAGSPTRRCPAPPSRPGVGGNLWVFGLALSGFGTILGAVNFITTIIMHARPGHDHVPDADLHLEHAGHLDPGADGVPGAGRGPVRPRRRPALRRAHLRPGQRRRPAVAAPVLVLRPPRGVHHRAAVLRHRLRDLPGLQPQADLRLQEPGLSRRSRSPPCR